MYTALIFLENENAFDLAAYRAEISAFYGRSGGAKPTITQSENRLQVSISGFTFAAVLSCEPYVVVESAEIAAKFAVDHPQQAAIATSTCRIELTSDTDYEMAFFNDYLYLIQISDTLGSIAAFDPESGTFL